MITERTLKRWRREALQMQKEWKGSHLPESLTILELCKRILRLTMELMDIHLLRKE